MAARCGVVRPRPVGQMRRKRREGLAQARDRFGQRGLRPHRRRSRPAPTARASTRFARRFGPVGGAVGAAAFGRLRDGHQQRRLGRGQPPRFLAEIGERGGAHPFEIAAEGREMQVKLQDLVLASAAAPAPAPPASAAACRQPARSPLSSSSRATCIVRVDPPETTRPFHSRLHHRPQHRPQVDPGMVAEPLVLIGQQHRQIDRVHLVRIDAPAASGHRPRYRRAAGRRRGPAPRPRFPAPAAAARLPSIQSSTRSRARAASQRPADQREDQPAARASLRSR